MSFWVNQYSEASVANYLMKQPEGKDSIAVRRWTHIMIKKNVRIFSYGLFIKKQYKLEGGVI